MKSIFSKIAVTTSVMFIAVGFTSKNVKAVTLGSITGNANEFSWTIDFNEFQRSFPAASTSWETFSVTPLNSADFNYWEASLNVSRKNNNSNNNDSTYEVQARHTSKPFGDDHNLDAGVGNYSSFDVFREGSFSQQLVIHPSGETAGGHRDLFTFTQSESVSNQSPSTLTITGKHEAEPVPEPLTILGSGIALGFGALFKKEYSRKQKKVGSVEKQKA